MRAEGDSRLPAAVGIKRRGQEIMVSSMVGLMSEQCSKMAASLGELAMAQPHFGETGLRCFGYVGGKLLPAR